MGPGHSNPSTIFVGLGAIAMFTAIGCQDDKVPETTRQAEVGIAEDDDPMQGVTAQELAEADVIDAPELEAQGPSGVGRGSLAPPDHQMGPNPMGPQGPRPPMADPQALRQDPDRPGMGPQLGHADEMHRRPAIGGAAFAGEDLVELTANESVDDFARKLEAELGGRYRVATTVDLSQQLANVEQGQGRLLIVLPTGEGNASQRMNPEELLASARMVLLYPKPADPEATAVAFERVEGVGSEPERDQELYAAIERAGGRSPQSEARGRSGAQVTPQATAPPTNELQTGTQSETAKNRAGSTASQAQPYMAPEPLHEEQDGDASPPDPIVDPDEPRRERPRPPEPDPYAEGPTGGDDHGSAPPPL